jgi:hypothetical protein
MKETLGEWRPRQDSNQRPSDPLNAQKRAPHLMHQACEMVDITVTLPKPINSTAKAAGRFGKQDFVYVAADDVYRCPAGKRLTYRGKK